MITLSQPIASAKKLIGFEVTQYAENVKEKYVNAEFIVFFDDKSREVRNVTLWSGSATQQVTVAGKQQMIAVENNYDDNVDWTDETASTRIQDILVGK